MSDIKEHTVLSIDGNIVCKIGSVSLMTVYLSKGDEKSVLYFVRQSDDKVLNRIEIENEYTGNDTYGSPMFFKILGGLKDD